MNHDLLSASREPKKELNYYPFIAMLYCVIIITGINVVGRITPISIFGYTIYTNAAMFLVPLIFGLEDVTTEVYGYVRSRRLVQYSILALGLFVLYSTIVGHLPLHPEFSKLQTTFGTVYNSYFRHYVAFLVAYFIGGILNSYLLSRSKVVLSGRYFGARQVGSTAIGDGVFQLVGLSIAWMGTLHFSSQILPLVVFAYAYNVIMITLLTPINYLFVNFLRNKEGIDVYDRDINYNPFVFGLVAKDRA